jgi:hypothetical protein
MLLVVTLALGVLTVPLAGGRLAALGAARVKQAWLLVVGLALQVLVIVVLPDGNDALLGAGHVASYAFVALFVVANRRLVGLWIVALGTGLTLLAIAANGGVMPADADALRRAGRSVESDEFRNSAVVEDPELSFLGDVFAVPDEVPLANVFSVGDVLIALGAIVTLHELSGSPWTRRIGSRAAPP